MITRANSQIRVLLTGADGFIGRHVAKLLSENSFDYNLYDFEFDDDVMDLEDLSDYDVVIHLAAVSSIPISIRHPRFTYDMNVVATQHLLNLQPKKLVFASSGSAVDPINPYSMSKRICEKLIEQSSVESCILRLGNVYGDGDNKSAVMRFAEDNVITINGDGTQLRNFVNVEDVAAAFIKAIDYTGKYVIANQLMSINEVAGLFKKQINFQDVIEYETHTYDIDWSDTLPTWKPTIKIEDYVKSSRDRRF